MNVVCSILIFSFLICNNFAFAFCPQSLNSAWLSQVNGYRPIGWPQIQTVWKASSADDNDVETGSAQSSKEKDTKKTGLIRRVLSFGISKVRNVPNALQSLVNRLKSKKPKSTSSSNVQQSTQLQSDITNVTTIESDTEAEKSSAIVDNDNADDQFTLEKVKEAGTAGVISYALWELAFWIVSVPVVLLGYYEFTGHWPDLSDKEDIAKLSAEAFAFVNFARFAVPLRIGLALSTTPWIQKNVVDKYISDKKDSKEVT